MDTLCLLYSDIRVWDTAKTMEALKKENIFIFVINVNFYQD